MMSALILQEIERYMRAPDEESESRLAYAKGLLSGFNMIISTTNEKDFACYLDYSQINEEELLWVISEINQIPTIDDGYDAEKVTRDMLLRDMVFRKAYQMDTMVSPEEVPAIRIEEVYF